MKLRKHLPGFLALTSVVYLTNCFGRVSTAPAAAATIYVTSQPSSIAVGASVTFTAETTNATAFTPSWEIVDSETGPAGTLNKTTGGSVIYTAPSTQPVYPTGSSYVDGTVELEAGVENSGGCDDVTATASFAITAPTVTAGLTPLTITVALGSTQSFTGYAVGNTNLGVTMQVAGVTGGASTTGTIAVATGYPNTFTYTAPATMPMSGNTVTVTLISQADTTKTATAIITLQQ